MHSMCMFVCSLFNHSRWYDMGPSKIFFCDDQIEPVNVRLIPMASPIKASHR